MPKKFYPKRYANVLTNTIRNRIITPSATLNREGDWLVAKLFLEK